MEDDAESMRESIVEPSRGRDRSPKKADWLSPLSDHFPTPRGTNFMSAPIPQSPTSSDAASDSPAATDSPTPSSAPWTRNSFSTDMTEFDDLYDVSDDEQVRRKSRTANVAEATQAWSRRASTSSGNSRASLPALVIPGSSQRVQGIGDKWPGVEAFKLLSSPVPPTPPAKVPMSPAIFSYLQSQEIPSSSAPPSLDGSLSSEQMAALSAPPTPDVGSDCDGDGDWSGGVQLQPGALATLHALSGHEENLEERPEQVIEIFPHEPVQEMQQSLPPLRTAIRHHNSVILSPDQQRAMSSLTRLEIPSPGGFFSALSPRTRHTWHLVPVTPDVESAHPPSSTTAEHFYRTPWSSLPKEQIAVVPEDFGTTSDGLPTARPSLSKTDSGSTIRPEPRHQDSSSSGETITEAALLPPVVEEEIVADEILTTEREPTYAQKIQAVANMNMDRTGLWLTAQSSFLSALINPTEDRDDEAALLKRANSVRSSIAEVVPVDESPPRKTVRFSEIVTASAVASIPNGNVVSGVVIVPVPLHRQESTYYRAFQIFLAKAHHRDTFIHRMPRFESLQAQRVSFPAAHRAQLLGKYQLSVQPMSAKRRMSSNVARGDEITQEDPEKLKRDREQEAHSQMAAATWNVMAIKLLNGGRLIAAPLAKRLARLSSLGPRIDGTPRDRARILDLGGQATCDWAWHCAMEYPNTKVYTVTTKALRQLSNSNIRGPSNHRQVAVNRLIRLPFKNAQFDLVSAREIHSILRSSAENGHDEWDICLSECMRILKPGGYLDFSIMDSDIVNAGPLGLAKSVEFGFNLKVLGYDPSPTKLWLTRLRRAGFVDIKRVWLFLPMGTGVERVVDRDSMGVERKLELEAMVQGSTESIASIAGLVGGWAWEKWLLRCKVQTLGPEAVAEGVQDIIEEGRVCGAGWRSVSGWARKPLS
ncbi:methyltransferase-containing protein [Coleophoma cylindrospora]|uniref:Methyltransferase-containing protein n=1 Tax=Coleophoma cylindrospora TaxID=1849047 RepID=A0A3D8SDP3_9HELO|nr:methyltransferase-containing protein [Coleophoma cylindrospora]